MKIRTILLSMAMLLVACASANAQTGKRLAIGIGPSWHWYQDGDFGKKNPGVSFFYRYSWHPHNTNGWKLEPAASFSWGSTDFGPHVDGPEVRLGSVRTIPLLVGGGPAYRHNNTKVGLTFEAGRAFHSFKLDNGGQATFEDRMGVPLNGIDPTGSIAARAGVALWQDLSTRFGLRVGASYYWDRPHSDITVDGVTTTDRWKLDNASASAGLVVGVF